MSYVVERNPDENSDDPVWDEDLGEDPGIHEISEYQGQKDGPCWKKLGDIRRGMVNYDFSYTNKCHPVSLFACRGYLLLVEGNKHVYVYQIDLVPGLRFWI